MKMKIDGHILVAKSPDTARGRDLIELQHQTGWGMEKLREEVQGADFLAVYLSAFLTLRNAGFTPDWGELLDRPVSDFEPIQEAIDEVTAAERAAENAVDADPQPALTASRQGDSAVQPATEPTAPAKTSKRQSPGSKAKSANA